MAGNAVQGSESQDADVFGAKWCKSVPGKSINHQSRTQVIIWQLEAQMLALLPQTRNPA